MTIQQNNIIHLFKRQIGNPIKEELKRQNKTISWLSKQTGLSPATLSKAIKGTVPLQARSPKTIKILAALNVDLNFVNGVGKEIH